MSGKRKEFPNNWKKFKDAPDEMFHRHTFDEIMDWRIAAWELPSNISCLIREADLETKKVTEHVYQRRGAAENKVQQLLNKEGVEFTVCTPETIHFVSDLPIDDYENELEDF